MRHKEQLKGNTNCWSGRFTYDGCCSLNANRFNGPYYANYNHVMWVIRLPPLYSRVKRLYVIQGAVLDNWLVKKDLGLAGWFPHQGVMNDGEGLLWAGSDAALALLEMNFSFPVTSERRFLEVASAVGAPSMVALARGFSVWSSDLRVQSTWQRRESAKASFGIGSPELLRLKLPILDLTNTSTWPKELFDVILFVNPGPVTEGVLCHCFRNLLFRHLHPRGVALYSRKENLAQTDLRAETDYECFNPDGFHVALHQHGHGGTWYSQWVSSPFITLAGNQNGLRPVFSLQKLL